MNKKLNNALNEISDKHLAEAENYKRNRRPLWVGAVAAVLALVIAISMIPILRPDANMESNPTGTTNSTPNTTPNYTFTTAPSYLRYCVAAPQYPQLVVIPDQSDYNNDYEAYDAAYKAWRESQKAQYNQPNGYADSLTPFFADSIRLLLSGEENSVYAPLNVYMALAMLAETTDGNSRQQILDLLGAESIEQLRQQATDVWNAHYAADGRSDLRLANALWLDESYDFHGTPHVLAAYYYASTFHGDLGTQEMDEELRRWLNANTGELLYDQTQGLSMDPQTVFALTSTVYFAARWDGQFSEKNTKDGIFHAPGGNITTSFMNKSAYEIPYYWGSNFSAVSLELSGDNDMWLILPDEGVTMAEVLASDEYLQLILDPNGWENRVYGNMVHLSLPKFDVSSSMDLCGDMQALGITDVFDASVADFSALTNTPGLSVTAFRHAARVAIDEEGVVGAAYTVIMAAGAVPPDGEIYFTLDRPFLFVVSSQDHLPIFAGTVMEP